jgi:TatD DNase family protein
MMMFSDQQITGSPDRPITRFLLDSHAHLDDSDFDPDRAAVIERARAAGLRYILIAGGGTGPDHLDSPLAVSEEHDWIYASVGIHPHDAQHFTDSHAQKILQLGRHPKVLAVGEIGLDYYYDHSPRDLQKQVLIRQMELARELKRPIIIHCRDAWADLHEVVAAHWKSAGLGGILHCFTGTEEDARAFIDLGFLISLAGNLTFKKAETLREVARVIPLDRLLTETDSPYLAPIPYRGKRNEPAYVRGVTQELARLRNLTEEEVARHVLENFEKLLP